MLGRRLSPIQNPGAAPERGLDLGDTKAERRGCQVGAQFRESEVGGGASRGREELSVPIGSPGQWSPLSQTWAVSLPLQISPDKPRLPSQAEGR